MKNFIVSMFLALIMGTVVASFIGINPLAAMAGSVATSAAYSFVPKQHGELREVVYKELFTPELIDKFRHQHSWIATVPGHNEWVGNNAIRLNEIGADPEVLIDNQIYPIATSQREDEGILISLHKYDTTNTAITDDELYAVPYDKLGSVQRQHREKLEEETGDHGAFLCSPTADSATTPVLLSTGPDDGTGRKRLVSKDVANLQYKYNLLKIPRQGRILRLCPEHVLDLLIEDKAFEKQYHNHAMGMIAANYYGFNLYEEFYNPIYDSNIDRKAYGSAALSTDANASIACYTPRLAKARGTVDFYYREARIDPEGRKSVAGFRLWHLVIPKVSLGLGALVSDKS